MAQISAVLEAFGKADGGKFHSGRGARGSSKQPAVAGTARGTMGVLGSTTLQRRNSQAGLDKERKKLMESPVMQAFMRYKRQRLIP